MKAVLVIVLLTMACSTTACSTLEKSAREDPMKCERDPKCEKKRGRQADCSMQCSDDPACVERCEQIQQANGRLGR